MMKLHEFLQIPRTFERGTSDCVRFAADWAANVCRKPVAEEMRKPMTMEEAEEIIEAHGGLEGAVSYYLELADDRWTEIEGEAEMGDIAVCAIYGYGDGGHIQTTTVGVVDQRGRVVVFAEDSSMARLPGRSILAAWRLV